MRCLNLCLIALFAFLSPASRGALDARVPQDSKTARGRLFVASFMTMHDPFFVDLKEGLKTAVESHGGQFLFLDGQHSREIQEKNTVEALKRKPAALFLIPATDAGSIDRILATAKAEGVPVIIVDTDIDVDGPPILSKVTTDNVQAGLLAAGELARHNPNARIGTLEFSSSQACTARIKGFMDEIAKHPGMKIVVRQDAHANREGVRGVIKEFLAAHPDMDAVFAVNDVSAIEALDGIEASGRSGKISVQGVAGSRDGARLIKSGKMLSSSAQMPGEIGKVAVQAAIDHLAGKPVHKDIDVSVKLVTKANADKFIQ
ncbi:MAG: substrate-binding domain-containing protein [Terracidiphilus sp.]|nr:substrate-binding domain-containing protein [Terracidiphilus sp.]